MYSTILPCDGWFYANKGLQGEDQVFPVAVWALTDEGEVVGLIAVNDSMARDGKRQLIAPAPIDGAYLTADQLSPSQRAALSSANR